MPPVGTKNLGLIKAIHVGVNPPLNVKILWFNDSVQPYTTGPAKVHYYYDVAVADWMPLGAGATINGIYTYIAFASSCSGADFSLSFDPLLHCFWAIVTSNTSIPNVNLVPTLFQNRWTRFCQCGGSTGSGNFTYVAFADDCEGNNFSTEMQYEVDCEDCQYADTFLVNSGNSSFQPTNTGDGVEIVLNNVFPGQQLILDVRMMGSILLEELIDYCVSISTLPNFAGEMEISLGVPSETINLNGPTALTQDHIQNQGSQLIITVPNNGQPPINSTITIKVGTVECCSEEVDGQCFACRNYFGIITSSTAIDTLTPEMFENRWIKMCCDESGGCDCSGEINILERQILNLNQMFQDQNAIYNQQIQNLTNEISNLQSQLVECCEQSNNRITDLENTLNDTIANFQSMIDSLTSGQSDLEDRVQTLEDENTSAGIMAKIGSDVTTMADSRIQIFKDDVYDPDRAADLDYVDDQISTLTTNMNTADSALSSGIGDLDTRVTANEAELADHEN
jgi:hypothetical protein